MSDNEQVIDELEQTVSTMLEHIDYLLRQFVPEPPSRHLKYRLDIIRHKTDRAKRKQDERRAERSSWLFEKVWQVDGDEVYTYDKDGHRLPLCRCDPDKQLTEADMFRIADRIIIGNESIKIFNEMAPDDDTI